MKTFVDRVEAGRLLGQCLAALKLVEPVVVALPRGGVLVAAELQRSKAARLVRALPVASAHAVAQLRTEVDDLVCLSQPEFFHAVGAHYRNFHQIKATKSSRCSMRQDAESLRIRKAGAGTTPAQRAAP